MKRSTWFLAAFLLILPMKRFLGACNPPPPGITPSVSLSWQAPLDGGAPRLDLASFFAFQSTLSYTIYRAPCSAGLPVAVAGSPVPVCPTASEGQFVSVGSTSLTNYTDTTVLSGKAYSFYVTAKNQDGESAPSNHVGTSIP